MRKRPYPRILAPPTGSFFLFGLRGTGKSTWARSMLPGAHRVDLLDEAEFHALLSDPGQLGAELAALPRGAWVVIDEVQRLPGLLNEVHRAMEERRQKFALLGSSARKLKTAGTNLLAGRAVHRTMFPLLPEELGKDFDLDQLLRWGTIAVIWASPDRTSALDAYARLYLQEEIRAEALVRNLPAFARFLGVAALLHGQVINTAGLARDAATARTTIHGYLEILEDTLVARRLPAFEARLRVRERRHPKLYLTDPGLVRALKRVRGPLSDEEKGPLFEGWVLGLLSAYAAERELAEEISYWAPAESARLEVDFLLRRGREFLAIEVKHRTHLPAASTRGLDAVADLAGVRRRILVHTGTRRMKTESGVEIWPVVTFLDALRTNQLWP